MKYVPGPIGALRDQAERVGFHLAVGPEGKLELQRENRKPIPLTGWGKKAWSKVVKEVEITHHKSKKKLIRRSAHGFQ